MHRPGLQSLTIERFTETTANVRSVGRPTKERRAEPRVGIMAEVEVMTLTPAGPRLARARVRDISRKGISLIVDAQLERDQVILIRLPSRGGGPSMQLTCGVAYCLSSNNSIFQIGTHVDHTAPVEEAAPAAPAPRPAAPTATPDVAASRPREQERIASAILD